MTTGKKLKELRKEKGLTQSKVIELLNGVISKNTLVNAENDNCKLKGANDSTLTILAEFYGVNIEYLRNPKCLNRNIETIDMGKYLNLSDKSLNKIKHIGELGGQFCSTPELSPFLRGISYLLTDGEAKSVFNSFIEDFDINDLSCMLKELKSLISIKEIAVKIYDIYGVLKEPLENRNIKKVASVITDYKEDIALYDKIAIDGRALSSYSKFQIDYGNIIEFKDYLAKLEKLCDENYSTDTCNNILNSVLELGINFIADVEREISMTRYAIIHSFERYLDFLEKDVEQYNFQ